MTEKAAAPDQSDFSNALRRLAEEIRSSHPLYDDPLLPATWNALENVAGVELPPEFKVGLAFIVNKAKLGMNGPPNGYLASNDIRKKLEELARLSSAMHEIILALPDAVADALNETISKRCRRPMDVLAMPLP